MTTTSAQKIISTSLRDDRLSSHETGNPQICVHCGANLPDPNPGCTHEVMCRSCGRCESDVKSFYLIEKQTNHLVSPSFATSEQAKQFAKFFQIPVGQDYGLIEAVNFYGVERRAEREAQLHSLDQNRRLLVNLLALPPDKTASDDLPYIACAAGLFGYALPQFREEYAEGEVA